jgi:hypothetical protein
MGKALKTRKRRSIDDRIEEFCKTSAELLAEIHARYSNMEDAGPPRRRRGRPRKKRPVEEEAG